VVLDVRDPLYRVVEDEADEGNGVAEDVEVDFEFGVVHVGDVDAALVNSLDGANDEGGEANSEEVDVLLPFFDVVEEDARLLDAVHPFLLGYVRQPLLKVQVLPHLRL